MEMPALEPLIPLVSRAQSNDDNRTQTRYDVRMMSHSNPKNEAAQPAETKASVKKPYQKPEVRREQVFETMALSCGKVGPTQRSCHSNRKAS